MATRIDGCCASSSEYLDNIFKENIKIFLTLVSSFVRGVIKELDASLKFRHTQQPYCKKDKVIPVFVPKISGGFLSTTRKF